MYYVGTYGFLEPYFKYLPYYQYKWIVIMVISVW